ncbi:GNAT family N-acetyltransferase [Kitasatospora sp. MAP5-34]|uniref:GNAT family N-acetyltransferase n=1 Tax=Kitasatospora sp. MAP5-34 TaxID=3035102 RepID=UPI0024756F34|nr:GNAT family N-acetyltransferase [Kitasatospora sp. MAP5-34]MDH6574632.1 hypothetical protein [Kitasatospora sp. MAP5-34]
MEISLTTDRLILRNWSVDDAEQALAIYGSPDVARWLTPAMDRVGDVAAMRSVLHAWQEAQPNLPPPRGRWAVQRRDDQVLVGGLGIRLLPPSYEDDLEVSWQLAPGAWGKGYATEARPRVHHVDLDAGYTPAQWPADFVHSMLGRVAASFSAFPIGQTSQLPHARANRSSLRPRTHSPCRSGAWASGSLDYPCQKKHEASRPNE